MVQSTGRQVRKRGRAHVRHKAKVLGIGPDGRKIYTKDADARAGKRTSTSTHPDGMYIGRELHALVAVREIKHTSTSSSITFGRAVPQVIVSAVIVPAGTHRGDAVLPAIV